MGAAVVVVVVLVLVVVDGIVHGIVVDPVSRSSSPHPERTNPRIRSKVFAPPSLTPVHVSVLASATGLTTFPPGPYYQFLPVGGGILAGVVSGPEVEALMLPGDLLTLDDLIPARPPWMAYGACRGMDPAIFFPSASSTADAAREVCSECPAREPCLQYALEEDVEGVWAGTSKRQRRAMRREAS